MLEMKSGRLGLYGAEYLKCNHMMTLGFKGLTSVLGLLYLLILELTWANTEQTGCSA